MSQAPPLSAKKPATSGAPPRARRPGIHGWPISLLTLGTLQFGGERGEQEDRSSIRTVHAALDFGINVIDTADSYGAGRSEEVVGKALGGRRSDVLIATKFDLPADGRPVVEGIRKALTESLRRLRTDYIDIYQVHNIPAAAMQSTGLIDELDALRKEGLVRAIGVTVGPGEGHGAECLMAARDERIASVQAAYNLLSPRLACVAFPYCVARGVAVFAREPLAQGLLTEALDDEANLRMGRRSRWTAARLDRAVTMVRSFDRLRSAGESRADFALRFALSNDDVTSVVCGMRSVDEVAANVRAMEKGPLQPEILQEVVDIHDGQ